MRCTEYFRDRETREARDEEARADVENGNTPCRRPYHEEENEMFLSIYADRVIDESGDTNRIIEDEDECAPAYTTAGNDDSVNVSESGQENCWTAAGMNSEAYQTYQRLSAPPLEEHVFVAALRGFFDEEDLDDRDRNAA